MRNFPAYTCLAVMPALWAIACFISYAGNGHTSLLLSGLLASVIVVFLVAADVTHIAINRLSELRRKELKADARKRVSYSHHLGLKD